MKNDKKIIFSLISVLFLYAIIGVVIMNNQKNNEKVYVGGSVVSANNAPIVEKVLLNKTKYAPGDDMKITVETQKAKSVKAFIENEKGYQGVSLLLENTEQEKQIWKGIWIVKDSLDMKEYNLKIVAYNDFGTYEKMTTWIDPNPGHDLSSIGVDQDLSMGAFDITTTDITVTDELILGGVSKTVWPESGVPAGVITMWYGLIASIPTGWVLCDGSGGTPDLRGKFVRGAPAATEPGTTGGADTHILTIAEMPAHSHSISTRNYDAAGNFVAQSNSSTGSTNTSTVGGGAAHNNMPAYYEVAFICKQ